MLVGVGLRPAVVVVVGVGVVVVTYIHKKDY
jgi:hypothetical protein